MTFPPIEAAILRCERHRFALESLAVALAETRAVAASIERKIKRARQAMAQAQAELSRAREARRYV